MRRYLAYFRYVWRHIKYVRRECWKRGLIWQGLIHDWDKWLPKNFISYARHFYNRDGSKKDVRKNGYYKPTETGDREFDLAWLRHQNLQPHHWQYWCVVDDDTGKAASYEMPEKYVWEMICDWIGAGKAQGFVSPSGDVYFETRQWYKANREKMVLNLYTRLIIESIIGVDTKYVISGGPRAGKTSTLVAMASVSSRFDYRRHFLVGNHTKHLRKVAPESVKVKDLLGRPDWYRGLRNVVLFIDPSNLNSDEERMMLKRLTEIPDLTVKAYTYPSFGRLTITPIGLEKNFGN